MYDIGFQALSRMVASGADIKVMVLDGQAYSNTGGQSSTASFAGQVTKLSAYGREHHGRGENRKELGRIMLAHGDVYVAQTTAAHLNHFYRAIIDANEYPGPAVVIVYTPCQPEHGIADDAGQPAIAPGRRLARLPAVHLRPAPRPRPSPSAYHCRAIRRCATTGRRLPDGTIFDFTAFARTEGRFAPHFGKDGSVSAELQASAADRLANWRTLQELAGIEPEARGCVDP